MSNGFIYVVYAHFIDKIEKKKKYPGPKCLWFRSSKMTQTKKGKEINIFKSLARSNVFSTKSEEQEVNLVWPNLCIF
jgi:hypothetical protein